MPKPKPKSKEGKVPPKQKKETRGRKTTLTKAKIEIITSALRGGATHKIALQAANISPPTFYRWLRLGSEGDPKYKDFYNLVKEAEGTGAIKHLANIEKHSVNDWRASAWLLERRYKYTKENQVEAEESKKEAAPIPVMGTSTQILQSQYQQLSKAANDALQTGSFQAFAALKRQEYKVALELRQEENKNSTGVFSDMNDDQILGEIQGLLMSLPPVLRQRIENSIIAQKLNL